MFENIVSNIICSEFEHKFGRSHKRAEGDNYMSDRSNAMQVTFHLSPDYKVEDGYRHLTLLIFGGGSNYYSVYGKIDWNVIRNEWSDGEYLEEGKEYVTGDTGWLLLARHDSCWREGVERTLWEFRDRISHIDSLFSNEGWYQKVAISEDTAEALEQIRRDTPGYGNARGSRKTLKELEFQFEPLASAPAAEKEKP